MKVYRFREADTGRVALTRDPQGGHLRRTGHEWHALGAMELGADGVDEWPVTSTEIKRTLLEHGAFYWPRFRT